MDFLEDVRWTGVGWLLMGDDWVTPVATLTSLGPRCFPGAHRQLLWAEVRAGRVLSRQEYPVGLTTSVAWILPPPHSVLGSRAACMVLSCHSRVLGRNLDEAPWSSPSPPLSPFAPRSSAPQSLPCSLPRAARTSSLPKTYLLASTPTRVP